MNEESFRAVSKALEEFLGFQLEETSVLRSGASFRALRPTQSDDLPSFKVALSRTSANAEAVFIADTFSGRLLRDIGSKVTQEPDTWGALLAESTDSGINTSLFVNGLAATPATLPDNPWRILEIECRTKIRRHGDASDAASALIAVTATCFGFALAGLNLEAANNDREGLPEGASTTLLVNRYERSRLNRMLCIRHHGHRCATCNLSFQEFYGALGAEFIEVHHVVPISQLGKNYQIRPTEDLVPLCSNCHSMVHRRRPPLTPQELRDLIC